MNAEQARRWSARAAVARRRAKSLDAYANHPDPPHDRAWALAELRAERLLVAADDEISDLAREIDRIARTLGDHEGIAAILAGSPAAYRRLPRARQRALRRTARAIADLLLPPKGEGDASPNPANGRRKRSRTAKNHA